MTQIDFTISIAHLYPDLLNIYGDMGNITALKKRCFWRGIEAEITEIKAGDLINPEKYDLYFIGGGQDGQQIMASYELIKNKNALIEAKENNSVMLAICGGYQLLGHFYKPLEGKQLDGIGLLDTYTVAGNKRFIGNISGSCPHIKTTMTGFENHSGLTFLQGKTKPLMKVLRGYGNNGKDKTEGAREKNVFGTYLHGSLLPKNPAFADYLISLALNKKYKCEIPLSPLDDEIEELAHKACLKLKK